MRKLTSLAVTVLLLTACDQAPAPLPAGSPTTVLQVSPTVTAAHTAGTAVDIVSTIVTTLPTLTAIRPATQSTATLTQKPLTLVAPSPSRTSTTQPLALIHPSATAGKGEIEVLASGFGSPDDLVVTPSGDIVFGDFGNKAVNVISASRGAGSTPRVLATGLNEPEGMVVAAGGALIVAEQGTNRILEVDMATGSTRMLRQLVNRTGKDGVDGLGIDPATGDILIPDSPNGTLLRMDRLGKTLRTVASGFVRPTGAAVEPGGTILVADEFGNAVYRLQPNGRRTKLASIYQPDDVMVGRDGAIYVNSLAGTISRIDPTAGAVRVIVSGLKLPHGLGIDPQGRLVVAEAGRNRIFRVTP